jgi:SAM-dependent MidA family methyltransferase
MAGAARAYYAARDPFADFATAPELSQAFGECLGLWAALAWEGMGRPAPVLLAEAGPGRGTLMEDALRAVAEVAPAFRAALRLHLIEASPRLRATQSARLPEAAFHDSLATLPDGPLILLANEFLDALPIRQFVRRGEAWRERWVEHGAFVERDAPDPPTRDAPEGAVCERGEAAAGFVAALARRGAAALFLDYGPAESGLGDSLQAMREGRAADPLAAPGTVDVTAHVDFCALAAAARSAGARAHGPLPQGVFLARLGLHARSAALAAANRARAPALLAAAHRLTAPEAMGRLFKALALTHPDAPPPPGFDA